MLLVEYSILDNVKVINESKNGVTKLKILGKFQKCDEQNNNGRIYPRGILESQVKAIQGKIDERSLVGALDHPANDAIHLSQASHLITKLWVEKNGDVMGEAEILSTPNGKIVEALIGDGVKIGISSRGLGSVSEGREGKVVNEDFKLITFDLVSDPSTKGAFPELTESMRENSQRAQAIVSKHRKDRVLLTMLESKIREAVSEVHRKGTASNVTATPGEGNVSKPRRATRKGSHGTETEIVHGDRPVHQNLSPKDFAGGDTTPEDLRGAGAKPRVKGLPSARRAKRDDSSTSFRDAVVSKIKEAFRTSQREWGGGSVPNIPTKTPTPEDIAAAQERDRKADAEKAADPETPGRNERQRKRILNRPRGIEKPKPNL